MRISLIYVSSAEHLMSNEELMEILRVARHTNETKSVTGMLLYKGGNFLQVLEGEEEDVLYIFEKIERDARHGSIQVLLQEPIEERQFAKWQMAFVNLDDESIRAEPAYSEFLRDEFTAERFRKSPNMAYAMLLTFKDSIR